LKGIVVKSTGSWFIVRSESDRIIPCRIKGKFRIKGIKTTNPVAVGDRVDFDLMPGEETGLITNIGERFNYIIRKSTKLSKVSHIIAANIDQALLVVTLVKPLTTMGFIDRFLVTAEAYHIPTVIIFNKYDLYSSEDLKKLDEVISIYHSADYKHVVTSAITGQGMEDFQTLMKDRTSLISGNSGVGKSTLIKAIEPDLDLKILEISSYHEKGQHATTFAEMHQLSIGGYIIDTPGIREFGLIDFDRTEVAERFPEFRKLMHNCKYSNCQHIHEPGCAVKEALAEGTISQSRYDSYLKIHYGSDWEDDKST